MTNNLRSKYYSLSGMTLIELMFVIAIIGILASIALPSYQNYIRRGEVGATLAFMTGLKSPITEAIQNDEIIDYEPVSKPMDYVQCITVTQYNGPDCDHVYVEAWPSTAFAANLVTPGLTRMLVLEAKQDNEGNILWKCGPHPEANKAIPASLLPSSCRSDITLPQGDVCSFDDTLVDNVECRFREEILPTEEIEVAETPAPEDATTIEKELTQKEKNKAAGKARRAIARAEKEAGKAATAARKAKDAARDADRAAKNGDTKALKDAVRIAEKEAKRSQTAAKKAAQALVSVREHAKAAGTKDAEKEISKAEVAAKDAAKSAAEAKKSAEAAAMAAN